MLVDRPTCPVCEEGFLTPITFTGDIQHNGKTLSIPGLVRSRCDHCTAEPVLEDQVRSNHRAIADARRVADGLMTGAEIRLVRQYLGITQQEAAVAFGGGANAFSKYERGDVIQSSAMNTLMTVAVCIPDAWAFIACNTQLPICDDINFGRYVSVAPVRVRLNRHQEKRGTPIKRKTVYSRDWRGTGRVRFS